MINAFGNYEIVETRHEVLVAAFKLKLKLWNGISLQLGVIAFSEC